MLLLKLIYESFGFAFSALKENRTRTILSLLGITIGIMTIIGVFSAVSTLRANLETSVAKLGSNTLYIQKFPWGGGGEYPWWRYVNRPDPTLRDYELLKERIGDRKIIALPLFHSFGLETLFFCLLHCNSIWLADLLKPDALLRTISDNQIDDITSVSSVIQGLISHPGFTGHRHD